MELNECTKASLFHGEQSEGQMTLGSVSKAVKLPELKAWLLVARLFDCTSPRAVPFSSLSPPWLHLEPGRTVGVARAMHCRSGAPTTVFHNSSSGAGPFLETP